MISKEKRNNNITLTILESSLFLGCVFPDVNLSWNKHTVRTVKAIYGMCLRQDSTRRFVYFVTFFFLLSRVLQPRWPQLLLCFPAELFLTIVALHGDVLVM